MKGKHGHKKYSSGGRLDMKVSGNPDVFKEAEGKESYDEGDERKHGGKVKKKKELGHAEGKMAKHRRDRGGKVCRAKGGKVGSDRNPLSSAHHGGAAAEKAGGQPD